MSEPSATTPGDGALQVPAVRRLPAETGHRTSDSGLRVCGSTITFEDGFRLRCGADLRPVTVACEIYGVPNVRRDNFVLVCHALSGGAHAAGRHPATDRPGWWDAMIGPGKAFDTDRYCVVSSNVLGSCYGTTGPSSINPQTGRPYGSQFPSVTVEDIVNVQAALLDRLGIDRVLAVAGGSMGGMQALQWAVSFPERVRGVIGIATTARHSAQQIAFDEVARLAIVTDPAWNGGDYYDGDGPASGLAIARMLGHITYLSDAGMARKFGRRRWKSAMTPLAGPSVVPSQPVFEVERYLHHQGESFVRRFDANSLVCLTRAMDTFDLTDGRRSLAEAFAGCPARFLLLAFSSDWLYPPAQLLDVAEAIRQSRGVDARRRRAIGEAGGARYCQIASDYGHDAFLLEHGRQAPLIRRFLRECEAREE